MTSQTILADIDVEAHGQKDPSIGIGPPEAWRRPFRVHGDWVPLIWSTVVVAVGIAYLLEWGPAVHHHLQWTTGGDLWGVFRAAHYVGWGFVGGIYDSTTSVNTFPGMSLLLAPVAMASGALGLSESSPSVILTHPSAALLVQPIELLLVCTVLFAANSLAMRLGIRRPMRFWLIGMIALVAWPVAAVWGHAEDVLAVTFALVAVRWLLDGKSRQSGWMMGIGIAFQPLVGFLLPVAVGVAPMGKRIRIVVQAALPSVLLIGIALAGNWTGAFRALVKQPTSPAVNHATPWVGLAPQVDPVPAPHVVTSERVGELNGHFHVITGTAKAGSIVLVSGGSIRIIGLALAVLIGFFVWRKRPDPIGIVWLCAVALALRCGFDPVMTPYYLAPPLIVSLIAAGRMGRLRFGIAVAAAVADTVFAYYRFSPWLWWLPVIGMLGVVLACGYPGRRHLVVDSVASVSVSNEGEQLRGEARTIDEDQRLEIMAVE
jgi:hypothetical protein